MTGADILNAVRVSDHLLTGGHPTEEQLRAVAADGVTAVINLAPVRPGQGLADEAGLVRSLGMAYEHIPVAWDDPRESDFTAFEAAMQRHAGGKLLVHCALNYRVTAFVSLYGLKHEGWSREQAEALRAKVWQGDYPAWNAFIERMTRACAG